MELTNLKHVVCINLDFHLWSARKKLHLEDLRIIEGEVPPGDLASLGSKKICNPEDLADFESLKKEAERKCSRAGVKFLGGFAVPVSKAGDLGTELDDIVTRFYDRKATFLRDYDQKIQDWIAAHPGWEKIIRDSSLDRNEVESKISAGWQAYKIVEADDADPAAAVLNKGLASAAQGLAGQLYFEIAKAADEVMEKSLMGREKVTQKILSPLRTIREKLSGLAFIDSRVRPLVDTITHVLSELPAAGPYEGMELAAIQGLVFILSDVNRMQKHGELILAGQPVADAFKLSAPKQKAAAIPAAPAVVQTIVSAPAVPSAVGNIKSPSAIPAIMVPPTPVVGKATIPNLFAF